MRLADATARDGSWRLWASVWILSALAFSVIFGFLLLPIIQGQSIGIDPFTSICRAIGITPGSPAVRQPVSHAKAQPTSLVVWSPQLLEALAKPPAGAAAVTAACAACHGARGIAASPQFPDLAGQSPEAIFKELEDFKSGSRVNPIMTAMAAPLTQPQMVAAAAQFASYPARPGRPEAGSPASADTVNLVTRGDPARGIAACNACHGNYIGGPVEAPSLSGQSEQYLATQLHAFKSGTRRNDIYARMRNVAAALSDAEINGLARFYSTNR